MSKFIGHRTEIVVSEDKIDGGYKLRVDIYENRRQLRGYGPDMYPSYRNEFVAYEIKYLDEEGNLHRESVDPKTGYFEPAYQKFHKGGILEKECWFKHGVLHRDEVDNATKLVKPAVVDVYGTKIWYIDGVITRDDDSEPVYIYRGVEKRWYKDGVWVRTEDKYKEPSDIVTRNGDIIHKEMIEIDFPELKEDNVSEAVPV